MKPQYPHPEYLETLTQQCQDYIHQLEDEVETLRNAQIDTNKQISKCADQVAKNTKKMEAIINFYQKH